MGEPIKECWDRRQYHTGLAHIKRNRRTQFGILGAAIKPKWDGPTYPKGMTQLTNVAGPTLVKPAGPLQVSGLKILTSHIDTMTRSILLEQRLNQHRKVFDAQIYKNRS